MKEACKHNGKAQVITMKLLKVEALSLLGLRGRGYVCMLTNPLSNEPALPLCTSVSILNPYSVI